MSSVKKALFAQLALVTKAINSANRLEMLEFLAQCEYSVEDVARLVGLSVANTSHHLQQLRQVGLVKTRKEGLRVYYNISDAHVIDIIGSLRRIAERHLAETNELVNTFLTAKDDMEPILREELIQRVKEGSATVLDVRPPVEYDAGHIPNAVNIPLSGLKKYVASLDPNQDIVAYCRGSHCILAFEAVKILRDDGFQVRRLEDGFPEWKSAGFPVERS